MRNLLWIALGSLVLTIPSATFAAPPNVVMVISDDQAWTDFGFMGHDTIQTPNLDKLAAQSAVFPRAYVPCSLCRPSLATLITGLYPHQHLITGNDPPRGTNRNEMLRHIRRLPTLPKQLGEKGYLSHQSGKWWEGAPALGGFTHAMTHGDPSRGGRHGDEGLKIGREGMQPVFDFIDAAGDKPYFLWYAPFMPHTPHTPPERLLKKYSTPGKSPFVARYQAMCEWFDETCGQLLDYIDQKGQTDNTLVLFVTDNGWIQQEDGRGYAPRSKRSPYEGGVRSPILVRWPGRVAPGRYQTLVSSIDLAPTILAACNLPAPENLPGLNLLDIAEKGGKSDRSAIFGEIFEHDVIDLDAAAPNLLYRWGIEGDWKLIIPARSDAVELYQLADDPHETKNLAARHPEVVARLTRLIDAWWNPQETP